MTKLNEFVISEVLNTDPDTGGYDEENMIYLFRDLLSPTPATFLIYRLSCRCLSGRGQIYRIAPQPESDHEIQIASLPRLAVFLPRSPEGDIT